ncbi:MAG: PDZ domain-containing protein [Saprospirales bacterium]|nr:PDZ domain-containing protein [Saprospirales bacterium]
MDGTIGPNVMKECYWLFDNKEKRITFTNDKTTLPIIRNGVKVPLYTDHVFKPSIDLQIGNYQQRVGFDTGFNGFLKLIDRPEFPFFELYPSVVKLGGRSNAGNSTTFTHTRMVKIDTVKLNGMALTNVIATSGEKFSSDLLGSQLFDYYKIMVDLSGNAMYFEEIDATPLRQGHIESFGMGFDYRDGKVVVGYVYESSAAHKKGIEPGQQIIGINGQNVEFADYCDFVNNLNIPDNGILELELVGNAKMGIYIVVKKKKFL